MVKETQITYLYNSGFSLELGDKLIIFDYYEDPANKISKILQDKKSVYVFASHSHFDHFNPDIALWQLQATRYFLSYDIKNARGTKSLPKEKTIYLNEYDSYSDQNIKVTSFSSTDEGISFLVEIDGWRIFHAGDFNWWHWKEDTAENIQLAKNGFMKQMKKLDGLKADIAFFPVDRRLEEFCDIGAREFCQRTNINYLITMHNAEKAPWKAPSDFPCPDKLISTWIPEKPGDGIKIIR